MKESKADDLKMQHSNSSSNDGIGSKEQPSPWLPEGKVSLISLLFLFFVGFYGIFMVSITWILYWVFAACFSPKIINTVFKYFLTKKSP